MGPEIQTEQMRNSFRGARCHQSRVGALLHACAGRKVIHIGCVDAGFYEFHSAHGKLLHAELSKVAQRVIGVDVDAPGLDVMRRDGFQDLVLADITESEGRAAVLRAATEVNGVDVIICGETIEHVPDVVRFMSGVLAISRGTAAEVILTTPNPFYFRNFLNALLGVEVVHPDHNAYLSATNLTTLVRKAGGAIDLRVEYYTNLSERSWRAKTKSLLAMWFPMLADGVWLSVRA
jgi:2-polyprenyl-3-methyl-5-hydroxy-6-metoxy-1,4-benzoquinol methylase